MKQFKLNAMNAMWCLVRIIGSLTFATTSHFSWVSKWSANGNETIGLSIFRHQVHSTDPDHLSCSNRLPARSRKIISYFFVQHKMTTRPPLTSSRPTMKCVSLLPCAVCSAQHRVAATVLSSTAFCSLSLLCKL